MLDIKFAIKTLNEPDRLVVEALIDFYETMKSLEQDRYRSGKQATKIVMTLNDIKQIFECIA